MAVAVFALAVIIEANVVMSALVKDNARREMLGGIPVGDFPRS